jgi:hypothetical protein
MDDLKKLVQIKYGIDLTEDINTLNVKLPFCKTMDGCKNLKYTGGLFTQCSKECDDDYCKVCKTEINKDGSKYGTVYDREKFNFGEFVSNTGKLETNYLKYMKQHGYTKEMVINAAKLRNITLPENIFNNKNTYASSSTNTKRNVIVDDTDSEKSESNLTEQPVKRGRGRPKKIQPTVISKEDIDEKVGKVEKVEKVEKVGKVEKVEKEEIEVELNSDLDLGDDLESSDSEDEEEIEVRKFEFKGTIYLKNPTTNKIYNSDGEFIGLYDENEDTIIFD